MSIWLGLTLAVLGVEYLFRVPISREVRFLVGASRGSLRVMRSQTTSERRKQVMLMRSALDLFRSSLLISLMLVGLILVIAVPALLLDALFMLSPSVLESFLSGGELLAISTFSLLYAFVRRRITRV